MSRTLRMIAAASAFLWGKSFTFSHGRSSVALAFQPALRSRDVNVGSYAQRSSCRNYQGSHVLFSSSTSDEKATSAGSNHDMLEDDVDKKKNSVSPSSSSVLASSEEPTPWNDPRVEARIKTRRRNNNNRFRQHVNPLARTYQQPTELSDQWPTDAFDSVHQKPLHVDIGCGKGGFLLEYAASEYAAKEDYNYLGLEIRPMVAQFAKERVPIHGLSGKLDFLGCNANVDLDRLLGRYHRATNVKGDNNNNNDDGGDQALLLRRVSIQYPDPHFKKQHAKRRVVTPALVDVVAKYMPVSEGVVFLQSDVQTVLDDMRDRFAEASLYFEMDDTLHQKGACAYLPENPLGIPTEREVSVLDKDLPVFRVLFRRTAAPYQEQELDDKLDANDWVERSIEE